MRYNQSVAFGKYAGAMSAGGNADYGRQIRSPSAPSMSPAAASEDSSWSILIQSIAHAKARKAMQVKITRVMSDLMVARTRLASQAVFTT